MDGQGWRTVPLFGGAMECELPERFLDVSDFRPVPDHQEVRWNAVDDADVSMRAHVMNTAYGCGLARLCAGPATTRHPEPRAQVWAEASTDQSIIVEIVEHREDLADADALDFFWRDLAETNEAHPVEVNSRMDAAPTGVAEASFSGIISGLQTMSKGRQDQRVAANVVAVALAVVRLPHVRSDVLVSSHAPVFISEVTPMRERCSAHARLGDNREVRLPALVLPAAKRGGGPGGCRAAPGRARSGRIRVATRPGFHPRLPLGPFRDLGAHVIFAQPSALRATPSNRNPPHLPAPRATLPRPLGSPRLRSLQPSKPCDPASTGDPHCASHWLSPHTTMSSSCLRKLFSPSSSSTG